MATQSASSVIDYMKMSLKNILGVDESFYKVTVDLLLESPYNVTTPTQVPVWDHV